MDVEMDDDASPPAKKAATETSMGTAPMPAPVRHPAVAARKHHPELLLLLSDVVVGPAVVGRLDGIPGALADW